MVMYAIGEDLAQNKVNDAKKTSEAEWRERGVRKHFRLFHNA